MLLYRYQGHRSEATTVRKMTMASLVDMERLLQDFQCSPHDALGQVQLPLHSYGWGG